MNLKSTYKAVYLGKNIPNLILPIISGMLLAISFPTVVFGKNLPDLGFLAWFSFLPLLYSLYGKSLFQIFRNAFIAGLVFNLVSLSWIYSALNNNTGYSWLLIIACFSFIIIVSGLYIGFAFLGAYWVSGRTKVPLYASIPTLWVAMEYLISFFPLGGFPWLSLGYSQQNYLYLIQSADIAGVLGVSFLVLSINVLIFSALNLLSKGGRQKGFILLAVVAGLMIVNLGYGLVRIALVESPALSASRMKVAVIPGNVPQKQKWDPQFSQAILENYRREFYEAVSQQADLIIWPETAIPYPLSIDLTSVPTSIVPNSLVPLLTGGVTVGVGDPKHKLNSIFLIKQGQIVSRYFKKHLVPLIERVPSLFSSSQRVIASRTDSQNEKYSELFQVGNYRFGMQICFEDIFPASSRDYTLKGAEFIVNLSSDAWYAGTSGVLQHKGHSIFRAIENRIPFIRVANKGLSTIVGPSGRVLAESPKPDEQWINGVIEPSNRFSVYSSFGNVPLLLAILMLLGFVWRDVIGTFLAGAFAFLSRRRPKNLLQPLSKILPLVMIGFSLPVFAGSIPEPSQSSGGGYSSYTPFQLYSNGEAVDLASGNLVLNFTDILLKGRGDTELNVTRYFNSTKSVDQGDVEIDPSIFTGYKVPPKRTDYQWGENLNSTYACAYLKNNYYEDFKRNQSFGQTFLGPCNIQDGAYIDQFGFEDITEQNKAMSVVGIKDLKENIVPVQVNYEQQFYPLGKIVSSGDNLRWAPPNNVWGFASSPYVGAVVFRNVNPFAKEGDALAVLVRSDGGLEFFNNKGKMIGASEDHMAPKLRFYQGDQAIGSITKIVEDLKNKLPGDRLEELNGLDVSHNGSNQIDVDKIIFNSSNDRTLTFNRYKHIVLHSQLYARNIFQRPNSQTVCDDTHGCYQNCDNDNDGFYDPVPFSEYRVKVSNIPHWAVDFYLVSADINGYGNAISYQYKDIQYPNNYSVDIIDTAGRMSHLQFGADNIVHLNAPSGREWRYYHNGDGQIRRVVDPQGNETIVRYSLAESNLPLIRHWPLSQVPDFFMEIRYPTGGVLRYEAVKGKDDIANGEVLTTEFPDDRDPSVYYQKYISISKSVISGEITTMLYERDGAVFKYTYSTPALLKGDSENKTPLLVRRELNAGYADSMINTYEWHISNVGHRSKVFGLSRATTAVGNANYSTSYTYNSDGTVAAYTDPLGQTTSFAYETDKTLQGLKRQMTRTKTKADGVKETIEATFYRTGQDICSGQAIPPAQVNRIAVRVDGGQEEVIQEYCFDADGNILKQTNLASPATNYHFDENGVFLTQIENESGITALVHNANTGDLTQVTGPEGNSLNYEYNSLGQVTHITYPNGSYVSYNYDVRYNEKGGNPDNKIGSDIYDSARKQSRHTVRTFDGMERLQLLKKGNEETGYLYGSNKDVSTISFPGNKKYNINYDGMGRVVSVTYPGGKEVEYSYEPAVLDNGKFANKLNIKLNGELYSTLYRDAKDKVISSVQYPGDQSQLTTSYRYDEFDNLIEVVTPEGLSTKNAYDHHNRLIGRTYPNGDSVNINNLSNESGLLDSFVIQDSNLGPVTATLKFDDHNRVTKIDYPAINGLEANDYTVKYANNRVSEIIAAYDHTTFDYTPDGSVSSIIQDIPGTDVTSAFQYGDDGFGTTYWMDYPDGHGVFYITDDRGRVSQVKMGSVNGRTIATMVYTELGKLGSIHFGNNVSNHYSYDASGKTTQIQIQKDGKLINQISYEYDEKGAKSSATYLDGSRIEYGYDGLNRITQAKYFRPEEKTPYNTQNYAYDGDGNRVSYSDAYKKVNYTYQKGLLSKVQIGSELERAFGYDVRGNLLSEKELKQGEEQFSKTFEYDFQNHLTKATVKDKSGANIISEYQYDYASRRTAKNVNGKASKYYVYGKSIDPLMELNKNGEVEKLFIYVGGRKIATFENEQLQYYHLDEMGNVIHTTDDAGNVTETLRYDPFGNTNFHVGLTKNDYRFGSKEYDETTGLIYYGARYYDPETGRFTTRDPMEQGINHYIFAKNNPLIFEEYFGMGDVVDAIGFVAGAVVGVVVGVVTGNPVAGIAAGIATASSIIGQNHTSGSGGGFMINFGFSGSAPGIDSGPQIGISVGPSSSGNGGFSAPASGGNGVCVSNQACLVIGENGPQITGDGGGSYIDGSYSLGGAGGGGSGGGGVGGGGPGGSGLAVERYLDFNSAYEPINTSILNTPNIFPDIGEVGGGGGAVESSPDTTLTDIGLPQVLPDLGGNPVLGGNDPFVISEAEGGFSGGGSPAPLPEDIDLPLGFDQQDDTPLSNVQSDLSNISANNTVADPVILYSGDLLQVFTDLKIPGRGLDFEFTRTYRSRLVFDSPLGFGWDHNYNKRLVVLDDGKSVRRFDGNARYDDYKLDPSGNYISPNGRFDRLIKRPDGTYTIRDRFGITYNYRSDGFITSIVDRNDNKISFSYFTAAGKTLLDTVVDTLGRTISYNYDGSAKLANVTDFTGRSIRFDRNGSGDLVAVHSPSTEGFPVGKVTQYSYSSGFDESSDHLNHNLLSVTDPSGQVYLQNEYSSTDRVVKQYLGDKSFTFSYNRKREFDTCNESSDPALVVSRTTVTDRNGNVTELQFNCQGNPLKTEEFTRGLRLGDPASFVTSYEYNVNGSVTKQTSPEGNTIEYEYDSKSTGDASLDKLYAGNLIKITKKEDPARSTGNGPLVTLLGYDPIYNRLTRVVDPKNATTIAWLDYQEGTPVIALADVLDTSVENATALFTNVPLMQGDLNEDGVQNLHSGNVIRIDSPTVKLLDDTQQIIQTRLQYNSYGQLTLKKYPEGNVDEYKYEGYLHQIVKDAQGKAVTNTFNYDAVGNVTAFTDGNNNTYHFSVNSLNQVIEETAPAPFNYKKTITYDANNNVSQIEVPDAITAFEYNELNRPVLRSSEPKNGHKIITEYQYDGNENLTRIIQPEGNSIFIAYDERDLPYQITRGFGTGDASTSAIYYDGNRNKIKTSDGKGNITIFTYDGFDRPVNQVDPLGNEINVAYDPRDNIGQINWRGPPDTLLKQVNLVYDEVDRLIAQKDAIISAGIVSGQRATKYRYNGNSKITQIVDGEGYTTNFDYDGLGRLIDRSDAVGNIWVYGYDANNNLKDLTTSEINSATGSSELFTTTTVYDALNRPVEVLDNAGHKKGFEYDSRGNLIFFSDAKDTPGLDSGPNTSQGNITKYKYDGLDRLTSVIKEVRENGSGNGPLIKEIATNYGWDDNSRLISIADAKDQVTTFAYDSLDRRVQTALADGSKYIYAYDKNSNVSKTISPAGFVVDLEYDEIDRLVDKNISRSGIFAGREHFERDPLNRLLLSQNWDATNTQISAVSRSYDSLDRLIQETQNGYSVTSSFDNANRRVQLAYPSGKVVDFSFDNADRLTKISEAGLGSVVDYTYAGVNRYSNKYLMNGTSVEFVYDQIKRVTANISKFQDGTILAGYEVGYDKADNRLFEKFLHETGNGNIYQYDSLYRLNETSYNVPNVASSVGLPPSDIIFTNQTTYTIDDVHNWISKLEKIAPADPASNILTNFEANVVNQYEQAGNSTLIYDSDGNLLEDGEHLYIYDYRSLLTEVRNKNDTSLIVSYRYDTFGRRIGKYVQATAAITSYIYDDWNVIEERDGVNVVQASYLYGAKIDEPISMERNGETYFYHTDTLGNVVALTNSGGDLVEKYKYDSYGKPEIHNAGGALLETSSVGNPYFYTAREYDPETNLYNYRLRTFNPELGRFMQRDPLGYIDSMNAYAYSMSNPVNNRDPFGLSTMAGSGNPSAGSSFGSSLNDDLAVLGLIGAQLGDALTMGSGMAVGAAEGVWGAATGLASAIASPVDTLNGIVDAVVNYEQTFDAASSWVSGQLDILANGSSFEQGRVLGNIAGNLWGGEMLAGAVGRIAEGSSVGRTFNRILTSERGAINIGSGADDCISLYHGSINDTTRIRNQGFAMDRGTVFVSRDIDAARNAIGPNRLEISEGIARDPGIVESRIPRNEYESFFAPLERPYSGFHGSNLNSTEITLRNSEQIELFNGHIVK